MNSIPALCLYLLFLGRQGGGDEEFTAPLPPEGGCTRTESLCGGGNASKYRSRPRKNVGTSFFGPPASPQNRPQTRTHEKTVYHAACKVEHRPIRANSQLTRFGI